MAIYFEPIKNEDKKWVREILTREWGSDKIITRSKIYLAQELEGIIAYENNDKVGILTYNIFNKECEIVSLNSLKKNAGIGTILLNEIETIATLRKCRKIWLVSTNDNTRALRFYQKRGYRIKAIHLDIIKEYRILKPEISLIGEDGIEIRDEIELEKEI